MKLFAVIDTNVLVSSLLTRNKEAATARLVDALFQGRFYAVYCTEILEEYDEVLRRQEFHFEPDVVNSILSVIQTNGICSDRVPSDDIVIDPKDVVFYEVSLSVDGAFLVTGNLRHFPMKPNVVTPAEMLSILEDKEASVPWESS